LGAVNIKGQFNTNKITMQIYKKETIYTLPYKTEEDIKKAQDFRTDLYDRFNSVQVYPNGLYEVRIICEKEI
jgi:hypothetical protein